MVLFFYINSSVLGYK